MRYCALCERPLKMGWRWANGRRFCLNQLYCYSELLRQIAKESRNI